MQPTAPQTVPASLETQDGRIAVWSRIFHDAAAFSAAHHRIFEKDAKKLKRETEAAGDFPKGEAVGKVTAFLTTSQANQDKYDTKTNHGEKEGVTVPV